MKTQTFVRRTRLPVSAAEAFRWHERPGAFERLAPPWEKVRVIGRTGGIRSGARVMLATPAGPWLLEHRDYVEGAQFRDVQVSGPFRLWEHTHRIMADGPGASTLEDRIDYALPFGAAGEAAAGSWIRRKLARLFAYRHAVTAHDLEAHRDVRPLRVLVTGATGLIGSELVPFLTTGGHRVVRLTRGAAEAGDASWDPAGGRLDSRTLEGFDAVVHLAGENISGRWTGAKKKAIRDSRLDGTRLLADVLSGLRFPPRVIVSASAVGYYGDRGDEAVDEDAGRGEGFLAELAGEWEAAIEPAARAGIRTVHLRLGVVLTPRGGALARMLTPFRLGVGGRIGSGRQYMSWISAPDAVGAIHRALIDARLSGPVNAVAPDAVTNREFTRTLASVLNRPALLPLPGWAARLGLGEMADELLLSSTRALPARLLDVGYRYRHATLEVALRDLLGR